MPPFLHFRAPVQRFIFCILLTISPTSPICLRKNSYSLSLSLAHISNASSHFKGNWSCRGATLVRIFFFFLPVHFLNVPQHLDDITYSHTLLVVCHG